MKALLLLLALSACNRDAAVEPAWGKQDCGHCGMIVDERASAAQLVDSNGERRFFDDAGCLAAWELAHPGSARKRWVHAADGEAWLPLERARFSGGARTPMGYGFVAHAAPVAGDVDWDALVRAVRAKGGGDVH